MKRQDIVRKICEKADKVVETEYGKVGITCVNDTHILITSGKDTGWFQIDNKDYYSYARLFLNEDGQWTEETRYPSCAAEVIKGMAGPDHMKDGPVQEKTHKVLVQAGKEWLEKSRHILLAQRIMDRSEKVSSQREHLVHLRANLVAEEKEMQKLIQKNIDEMNELMQIDNDDIQKIIINK